MAFENGTLLYGFLHTSGTEIKSHVFAIALSI
jgi:hypothetical protein